MSSNGKSDGKQSLAVNGDTATLTRKDFESDQDIAQPPPIKTRYGECQAADFGEPCWPEQ
jgi:hypothetical protein